MVKEKYYVNLQSQEISKVGDGSNRGITIHATGSEVEQLRKMFNTLHSAEFSTFMRSHVPILPYHHDKSNDQYDRSISDAMKLIHDLGNEETKMFIRQSGVLDDQTIDTESSNTDSENHSHSDL